MTTSQHRHRALRIGGAAAMLVTALAACGTSGASSSDTGSGSSSGPIKTGPGIDASAKTISLGVLTPLSGPVAVIGKPLTRGQEVYFSALKAKGGIDGYNVNLVEKDTQYSPQMQVQQYNAVIDQVAFIAQSLGSPTTLAIQKQADQQKVLIGAATQSGTWVTDPVMAVIGNPYSIDVANGVDYIVNKLGKKDAKIGIIYQNDEYGADGLRGYKAALTTYHFNDVGQVTYASGDQDFSSQIAAMKSAGAQYVFLIATPTFAGKIIGTAAAGKYLPQFFLQGPAWTQFLMTKDGTAAGIKGPLYAVLPATTFVLGYTAQWGDTSVPGMQQFLADQAKYAPDQSPDYYFMYGYCEAEMEAAVLKKAIESNDLSRDGILKAKLNLGKVSFGGLISDINYTPQLGPASVMTTIAQVDPTVPGFLKQVQPAFEGDAAKSIKFGSS